MALFLLEYMESFLQSADHTNKPCILYAMLLLQLFLATCNTFDSCNKVVTNHKATSTKSLFSGLIISLILKFFFRWCVWDTFINLVCSSKSYINLDCRNLIWIPILNQMNYFCISVNINWNMICFKVFHT